MSKTLCLVPLLALLLAACANAARFPSSDQVIEELPQSVLEFQQAPSGDTAKDRDEGMLGDMLHASMFSDLEGLAANVDAHKGKWPIQIVSKYLVRPDLHIKFVRKWRSYQADASDEKGILHLSLNKVAGDNIVWTSYIVFKDVHAVFKHLRSEGLRDLGSFITDTNIAVEYYLLFKVAGGHRNSNGGFEPNMPAAAAADNKKHHWPSSTVRLVTKYFVPPGDICEFVHAWEKLEDDLAEEKGNLALVLNKPAADNTLFVSYSAWESPADFWDAARRKSTEKFLEFLGDKDIVAVTEKLWKVPDHRS